MADIAQIAFGTFLILGGALSAVNHLVIDGFNRLMKSTGTTRRLSDIEMLENVKVSLAKTILKGRIGK